MDPYGLLASQDSQISELSFCERLSLKRQGGKMIEEDARYRHLSLYFPPTHTHKHTFEYTDTNTQGLWQAGASPEAIHTET